MLKIIYYTFIRQIRDKQSLVMMLVFPIVLILVLGSALSGAFEVSELNPVSVYYINDDQGAIGAELDNYLKSDDMKKYLTIYEATDLDKAKKDVKEGVMPALIYIDSNYTKSIYSSQKAQIYVFSQSTYEVSLSVIEQILEGFSNTTNTINAIILNGQEYNNEGIEYGEYITELSIGTQGNIPKAIDYYAVTMLVMIMMYGAMYGTNGIADVLYEELGDRLSITPVSKPKLYIGNMLGLVGTVFLQALLLLVFTRFAYGVNWGDNIFPIILVCLLLAIFSVSLGVFVSVVTQNRKLSDAIINLMIPVFTFISGGYFKFQMANQTIDKIISYACPNAMAQTAIFNTIYGGPKAETVNVMLILASLSFVLMMLAVVFGRRRVR